MPPPNHTYKTPTNAPSSPQPQRKADAGKQNAVGNGPISPRKAEPLNISGDCSPRKLSIPTPQRNGPLSPRSLPDVPPASNCNTPPLKTAQKPSAFSARAVGAAPPLLSASSPAVFSPITSASSTPTTSSPARTLAASQTKPQPPPPTRSGISTPTRVGTPTTLNVAKVAVLGSRSPAVFSPALTAHSPLAASSPVGSPCRLMSPPPLPPRSPRGNPLKMSVGIMKSDSPNYESDDEIANSLKQTRDVLSVLSAASPQCELKSSAGLEENKGFKLKSFLLKSLGSQSVGSQSAHSSPVMGRSAKRRSSTPPPVRPATPDSPTRPRKLSEPVPIMQSPLTRRVELLGSQDGISSPYNVTRNVHVDHSNIDLLSRNPLALSGSVQSYEKQGYLHKLTGSSYKERWVACRRQKLIYYTKKGDTKPRGEIFLCDCEVEREKGGKRKNTLHVQHLPTKKNYYFSSLTEEEMQEWLCAILSAGAVDKDFIEYEKQEKERIKKEEDIRKARELRKKENDYVKEKFKKRSTLKLSNKNMDDCAIRDCSCDIKVIDAQVKEDRVVFKMDITFDDQQWSIFRKYDKVVTLYNAVYKLKIVKGMCPPKKAPTFMSEADFMKTQQQKLQELLSTLIKYRACVLNSGCAKQAFLRFIAPVGWDDVKPETFIMPFAFDF